MSKFRIETYKKLQREIIYNGIQKDRKGWDYGYMFTDRLTGSRFLIRVNVPDYEAAILDRLNKIRKKYNLQEAKCN